MEGNLIDPVVTSLMYTDSKQRKNQIKPKNENLELIYGPHR